MAPLYELILLTKTGNEGTPQLKKLLKTCATHVWDKGGVVADIRPWGHRELAYRIRKQKQNYYHAQYTSLHIYASPPTLHSLEATLRNNEQVLRHMTLKQESTPKLDLATQHHGRFPVTAPPRPEGPVDLEADPTEAARWEYRNLVMRRIFEGRTKSELIAEQLVRHRFQHAQQRAPPEPRYKMSGPLVAALRRPGEAPPELGEGGGGEGGTKGGGALPPPDSGGGS